MLDGKATAEVGKLLGWSPASLQLLLDELTRSGRRGFVVGLACNNRFKYVEAP